MWVDILRRSSIGVRVGRVGKGRGALWVSFNDKRVSGTGPGTGLGSGKEW